MNDEPVQKSISGGELVIVAVILAILSAILLPQCSHASADARRADMPVMLSALRSKLAAYRVAHGNTLPAIFYSGAPTVNGSDAWTDVNDGPVVNPLNGLSSIGIVDSAPADCSGDAGSAVGWNGRNRAAPAAGWILNTCSGRLWATAADSRLIFDESAPASPANFAAPK